METYQIWLLIIGCVFVTMSIMMYLIPYLQKKGWNIGGYLGSAATITKLINSIIDAIKPYITPNSTFDLVEKIFEITEKAVTFAEQAYKDAQCEADQRKSVARKYTIDCLKLAGIEVTEDIEKLIDGALEAAVFVLPKTHDETDKTVV